MHSCSCGFGVGFLSDKDVEFRFFFQHGRTFHQEFGRLTSKFKFGETVGRIDFLEFQGLLGSFLLVVVVIVVMV
jgi:hypothetical protein